VAAFRDKSSPVVIEMTPTAKADAAAEILFDLGNALTNDSLALPSSLRCEANCTYKATMRATIIRERPLQFDVL
jgi:hypothetical protein